MATSESGETPVRRITLGSVVRIGFLVLVLVAAVYWVYRKRHEMADALSRVSFWPVLGAIALSAAGAWSGVPAWRSLLAGLGSPLTLAQSQRVFLLGQLGKYIPGGVWSVVAQATMARDYQVPRTRSATASLMSILLSVVTAATLGGILLATSGRAVLGAYWWAVLLFLPLLVLVHPGMLVAVGRLAARVTKRDIVIDRIPERRLLQATGWLTAGQVLNGLQLYVLAASIAPTAPPLLLAIGLLGFASAAGLVIVFAPAGAGIREVILVFGLTPYMTAGEALLVVLLSRLVMTVVDFLWAGTAALQARSRQSAGHG